MSFDEASITIVGNVGGDPDMRYTPSGQSVTNFSVAVNTGRPDAAGNAPPPEWFRVSVWGKQAELADQLVSKGARIYVRGPFRTSTWTDQEGNPRTSLELMADRWIIFPKAPANGEAPVGAGAPRRPIDDNDLPF